MGENILNFFCLEGVEEVSEGRHVLGRESDDNGECGVRGVGWLDMGGGTRGRRKNEGKAFEGDHGRSHEDRTTPSKIRIVDRQSHPASDT